MRGLTLERLNSPFLVRRKRELRSLNAGCLKIIDEDLKLTDSTREKRKEWVCKCDSNPYLIISVW